MFPASQSFVKLNHIIYYQKCLRGVNLIASVVKLNDRWGPLRVGVSYVGMFKLLWNM
jgi:hypothetical protein